MKKWIKTMSASLFICLALAPSVQAKNARADLKAESVKANVKTNVTFPLVIEVAETRFLDTKQQTSPPKKTYTYTSATKCNIVKEDSSNQKKNDNSIVIDATNTEAEIQKKCDSFFKNMPKQHFIDIAKKSKIPFTEKKQTISIKVTPKQMGIMQANDLPKEKEKNKTEFAETYAEMFAMFESIEMINEYNDKNNIIKQTIIMTLSSSTYEDIKKSQPKDAFKQTKQIINITYNPKKKTK